MNWFSRLFSGGAAATKVELTAEQTARLDAWRKLPKPDIARSHFVTRYIVADVEASGLNMVKEDGFRYEAVRQNKEARLLGEISKKDVRYSVSTTQKKGYVTITYR